MPYLNIASNTINRGEMSADEMLRLISPDLTVELIHDIVAAAYDPYVVGMSDFAPINGRGLELYIRATENLRDRLSRTGWRVENIFEVPAVANKKDKVRLVCTTSSDGRVGKSNCAGPAIHDKAKGTLRLAGVEGRTMPIPGLEGYLGEGEPAKHDDLAFYYLIMHIDKRHEEIRIELSMPAFSENGVHSGWKDRVLLPSLSTNNEPPIDTTEAPTPNIEVIRKTA